MRILFAGLALTLLVACARHSNVTTQSAGGGTNAVGPTIVPAGAVFYGKLQQPIGSKISRDDDTFAIDETRSTEASLRGAAIEGHLEGIRAAGPMRNARMTIVFDDIRLADGTKVPVNVQLMSLRAFSPRTHHLRTIGMMIGGAITGHEVAVHSGRRHGALAGAAGGYALSQTLKTDIDVPAGTVLGVRFKSPVTSGATSNS